MHRDEVEDFCPSSHISSSNERIKPEKLHQTVRDQTHHPAAATEAQSEAENGVINRGSIGNSRVFSRLAFKELRENRDIRNIFGVVVILSDPPRIKTGS